MKRKKKYMKLISIETIGNSNDIGTILSGSIQEVKSKEKTLFSFFTYMFIYNDLITSHRVGH